MYNDFGKFFEIARRTNHLNVLLLLNTRVSSFSSIVLGSRQQSFSRRAQVGPFRIQFNLFPGTSALNLSRRDLQPTNNKESTKPMMYNVSFTDHKMLDFKLKIYGKLYNCLPQTNELD